MKKGVNIQINFTNRAIYTFIALAVFLVIGVTVFAFGTSSPSTFGHSAGELDLSEGVDGDVVFRGNVDVAGDLDVTQRLDVRGSINIAEGIKIGDTGGAACDATLDGVIQFEPTLKKLQICDSAASAWTDIGVGGIGEPLLTSCLTIVRNSLYTAPSWVSLGNLDRDACATACEQGRFKYCSRYTRGDCYGMNTFDRICNQFGCGCSSGTCYDARWDCHSH